MRDRLIELLDENCGYVQEQKAETLADKILADGWMRLPCKVGQTVYVVNSLFVSEYTIKEIAYDDIFLRFYCENDKYAIECRNFIFFDERIGKTVFLTREDAEKALQGVK